MSKSLHPHTSGNVVCINFAPHRALIGDNNSISYIPVLFSKICGVSSW